jgi:signal peptidase II
MRGGLFIAGLALILDQASKHALLAFAFPGYVPGAPHPTRYAITDFFAIVMVWNKGVSFSLLRELDARWALVALSVGICAVLVWWMRKAPSRRTTLGLGLVVGGALGNAIDRIIFGSVADFLLFHAWGYAWPAFNVADSCIFMGVVLLLFDSLFAGRNRPKTEP